jgi:hypothetical protein
VIGQTVLNIPIDDDDDDDYKPVWPLGLWAPSSEGVRNINHCM